jgi:hypothetical protein
MPNREHRRQQDRFFAHGLPACCIRRGGRSTLVGLLIVGGIIAVAVSLLILNACVPHRRGDTMDVPPSATLDATGIVRPFAAANASEAFVLDQGSNKAVFVNLKTREHCYVNIGEGLRGGPIAVTSDGKAAVVMARRREMSVIQVWDFTKRTCRRSIEIPGELRRHFVVNPGGTEVFVARPIPHPAVLCVDLARGSFKQVFGPGDHTSKPIDWKFDDVEPLAVTPDGDNLVVGGWMKALVWNVRTRSERFLCSISTEIQCSLAEVSPDGKWMATGGGPIEIWDLTRGARVRELRSGGWRGPPIALEYTPDGRLLVAGFSAGADLPTWVVAWQTSGDFASTSFVCDTGDLSSFSLVAGAPRIIVGSEGGIVRIWDLETKK